MAVHIRQKMLKSTFNSAQATGPKQYCQPNTDQTDTLGHTLDNDKYGDLRRVTRF